MKDIELIDVIRSILLGEGACMLVACLLNSILILIFQKPRPGRYLGVVCATISIACSIVLVVIGIANRLGGPPDFHVWLCMVALTTGNLGFCLLLAHTILHHGTAAEKVMKFFKDNPDHPIT